MKSSRKQWLRVLGVSFIFAPIAGCPPQTDNVTNTSGSGSPVPADDIVSGGPLIAVAGDDIFADDEDEGG